MTVLFRKLRLLGYGAFRSLHGKLAEAEQLSLLAFPVTVFILASGVLGIASYFASQFLPHTRCQ
jgi:hypothetical protein